MSASTMFSPLWHRVEQLRLRLKPGVAIERQIIRGDVWYATRDRMSGRAHRFSAPVYQLLIRMDGSRTVGEIWEEAVARFGEDAPAQDQVIQAIGQLYAADLVHADAAVDQRELADRAERLARMQWTQRYQNPVFFKLPLFNPDRFFTATIHLVRPLFTVAGFCIWLALTVWLVSQVAVHWTALTGNAADRILAPSNLVVMLLLFPVIKIAHELGHGYATKARGGDVPEVGIMFLVLVPAPYVDASTSALFPRKLDRIIVAAAGMMTELAIAAGAMAVWLAAEPGPLRAAAFNVLVIAGVSTVLFNGNPLLRFDGYYILSDLLEVPNLAARSSRFWINLVQRHLFGLKHVTSAVTARGETKWFLLYAPLAFAYRLMVVFSIAFFIGGHYFVVGILLAIWTLVISVGWPMVKAVKFVLLSPALSNHRLRAALVTSAGVLGMAALVGLAPIPYGTVAEGIVWIPGEAQVVTDTAGTIRAILHRPGDHVRQGEPLFELDDPYAAGQRQLAEARLSELHARLAAAETASPVEVELVRQRITFAEGDLAEANRRLAALIVRSPVDGTLIMPRGDDMMASHAAKGTLLGYVIPAGVPTVRVAVPEPEIDTVRGRTRAVTVRLASAPGEPLAHVVVARDIPGGRRKLPSPALAANAGGPFALDTTQKNPDTTIAPFFELDLQVTDGLALDRWGERVHVRFDHGSAPLVEQLYRSVRQMFLTRFNA